MSVVLPIEEDPRFRVYTASAGQVQFPVEFPFQQDDDVATFLRAEDGGWDPLSQSLYAIEGAGTADGGMITFHVGRVEGETILVLGAAVLDRMGSIVASGRFSSHLIDSELDRNRLIQQELYRDTSRALKMQFGQAGIDVEAGAPGKLLVYRGRTIGPANELPDLGTLIDQISDAVSQGNVPIYASVLSLSTLVVPIGITAIRVNGFAYPGDDGAWPMAVEVPNTGPVQPWQRQSNFGTRRWELRARTVRPEMFALILEGVGDHTGALQACFDYLPARGGKVRLMRRWYRITQTLQIGDGDGGTTASSKNAIVLRGAGGAGFARSGTIVSPLIQWVGAVTDNPMISVNGQISDCELGRFFLACEGKAGGIRCTSFSGCNISKVKIVNPKSVGLAVLGGGAPTGNYNVFNRFSQINIALITPGSTGVFMDGVYAPQNDTWISDFDLVRVEAVAGATGAVGFWFKFVDSCSFRRCHSDCGPSSPEPTSIGVIFDARDNHEFPAGMAFYDCSFKSFVVYEDGTHKIRKNYFYGLGTLDLEALPTHPMLCGITDTGEVFGDFLYNLPWTAYTPATIGPTVGSGMVATATAAFRKVGRKVDWRARVTVTNNGTGSDTLRIALPPGPGNVVAATNAYGIGRNLNTGEMLLVFMSNAAQWAYVKNYASNYPVATGHVIEVSGVYEVA